MSLYQNMNQFAQTALKGKIAMGPNNNTISVQIYASSVATLIPGDFVKLVDVAANVIIVDKAAASDAVIGCILANPKKESFVALDAAEIALNGSIVNLESQAAIARGADLELVASGTLVKTNAGSNTIVGTALDKASAANQLVRVLLKGSFAFSPTITGGTVNSTPIGASSPSTGAFTLLSSTLGLVGPDTAYGVFTKRVRCTVAEINAGKEIVAAVTGKKLRLIDAKLIAIGGNLEATASATGVAIYGTQSSSSVALFTANLAQLTRSAVNRIGTASTAVLADGASFVQNDAASAITAQAVGGSDLITATHVDVEVTYAIEA